VRAAARHRTGHLEGGRTRVGVDPGRQAQRHRLGPAHDPPGEGQLLGHVPAHEFGEQLGAGHVRHQAPADLQHRHPRVRGDDADVGAERDLQAAAQGVTGHGRDDRDRDLRPDVRGALPGAAGWALRAGPGRAGARRQVDLDAEPLAGAHRLEGAEVQARAEVRSLPGQHDRPDARLGLEPLARRDQAGEHRPVQGVALVRPGHADLGYPVGDRHRDPLFGHHRSLARVSTWAYLAGSHLAGAVMPLPVRDH
jgi:hypothetical protein